MITLFRQRRTLLALGLILFLVGQPAHVARAQGETPVVGPPSISGALVAQVLSAAHSPLAEFAADIYRLGTEATIDPAFALAIWRKESSFGTTGASARNLNMGNLICEAATRKTNCSGRWAVYATWLDAIQDWYAYIQRRYISQGLTTVEAILPVYAPPSENDTALYINQVNQWMREWGSGVVGTAPAGSGGGWLGSIIGGKMDDWIYQPIDKSIYTIERVIAAFVWLLDRAGLYLVDLIERWRLTIVSGGLRGSIQAIADAMSTMARTAFLAGLTVGLVVLLMQPLLKLQVVNLRKLLLFAFLVPIVLPAAGRIFQDLELFRADMGSTIYDQVFSSGAVDLIGNAGNGAGRDQDMPELAPFYAERGDAKHGVDVAAAYLYADRADVIDPANPAPSDLPDAFAKIYFPRQPDELSQQEPAERQRAIQWAGQGIARLAFGMLLVLFAIAESVTNLLFTLGLGFLLIGLVVSFIFGYLAPVEHISSGLGRQALQVFIASWGVSALQGLVMAVIFGVATARDANAMLGIGILGLALECIFVVVAAKSFAGAVLGAGGMVTGGALTGETAAAGAALAGAGVGLAASTLIGGAARGDQLLSGTKDTITEVAGANVETSAAYGAARRAGNSRQYAAAFAGAGREQLRTAMGLANAMGKLPAEMERGLHAATTPGEGQAYDPMSSLSPPLRTASLRTARADGAGKRTTNDNGAAPNGGDGGASPRPSPAALLPLTPDGGEQSVVTAYPDGRSVTDWGGGYTETRYPDGRTVQRWPNGYEQTVPAPARGSRSPAPTPPAEQALNLQPLSMLQAGTLAQQQAQFGAATGTVRQMLDSISQDERREGLEAVETVIAPLQAREAEQAFFGRDGSFDSTGRGVRHVQALLGPNHPWRAPDALAPLVEVALGRRDERADLARAIGGVVEICRQQPLPVGQAAPVVARAVGLPHNVFARPRAIDRLVRESAAAGVSGALVEQIVVEVGRSAEQQPTEETANALRAQLRGQFGPKDAEQRYQEIARLARHVPASLAGAQRQPAVKSGARIYDQTTT